MLLCDMAQAQSKKETYLEEVTWKKTIFALPGEGDDMDVEPDGVPGFFSTTFPGITHHRRPPKILHSAGVFTFLGVRGWEKRC